MGVSEVPLYAVTAAPLAVEALTMAVMAESNGQGIRVGASGAVASFLGIVRGENAGRQVERLEYEAYEPLATKTLARIGDEARQWWPGVALGIHHRVGVLALGEASVAIVAASAHRAEAFGACRFAIERIKQIAPIWKREYFTGGDVWIEGATADPDDEEARREARRRACA
jgi:molybdopterin synthase catalytic subunit